MVHQVMSFSSPYAAQAARIINSDRWPPPFPIHDDRYKRLSDIPREQWSGDDWRLYAEFIEGRGFALMCDLASTRFELAVERQKLKRSTNSNDASWPTEWNAPTGPQRGRPPATDADVVRQCLDIQAELKAKGRPATDRDAVTEYYYRKGQRPSRAQGQEGESIRNAMRRYRRRGVTKSQTSG
jgi:hypothetical protein